MTDQVLLKTLENNLEEALSAKVSTISVAYFISHCKQAGLLEALLQVEGFEEFLKRIFPELIERLLLEPEMLVFMEKAFPALLKTFFLAEYASMGENYV